MTLAYQIQACGSSGRASVPNLAISKVFDWFRSESLNATEAILMD